MNNTFCITLDDARAQKIRKDAAEMGLPAATYLRSLVEKIIIPQGVNDLCTDDIDDLIDKLYQSVLDTVPLGEEFILRDLPDFSDLCVASADKGSISVETIRARVGKQWNSIIRHDQVSPEGEIRLKGISRANRFGKLKFRNGAAVYIRDDVMDPDEELYRMFPEAHNEKELEEEMENNL